MTSCRSLTTRLITKTNKKRMKTKLLLFVAVLGLGLSSCSKYKYEEVKGDLSKTRIYTLDNGLKVYLSVNKEQPRIQTYIAVRTGSKNDPCETTGLAHYLEHLMFKGTDKFGVTDPEKEAPLLEEIQQLYERYRVTTDTEERKMVYHMIDSVSQLAAQYNIPNEYDKLMAAIGSEGSNAFTSNDVTCYVEDIPSNEVENWAKIQSDRFMNMVIRGFHTELEAVYEEYNIGLSEDMNKLYEAMGRKLCPTHPYGTQTTIGTQEHLKNPSIRNIKMYFQKWYVPNNVAICMSGDFDPDEVIATIDKYFGAWKQGGDVAQPQFPEQPVYTEPQDTSVIGPEAETIWLGWRFDRAASLQADTLDVIENMLSNGTAGLLDLDINQQMKMLESWGGSDQMMDYSFFILAGTPKDGQTLDEVRSLLLEELGKLKRGEFSDDLLPSVINNMKLQYYNALENNRARTQMFMKSFINGTPWEQYATRLNRIAGMTKQQIVDFANRHFTDVYAAVYKRQGIDPNQKKIDKPAITPIAANRDNVSQFVKDIQASEVKPIEPKFVDFKNDLTQGKLDKTALPYAYVQNTENGRFQLSFRYEFGNQADPRYDFAAGYLDYLGTDSLTAVQVKQQFYKLACNYNINVGDRTMTVSLYGLSENMAEAVRLLENLMANAKADSAAYDQFVGIIEKARADAKLDQRACFDRLVAYSVYGPYNAERNILPLDVMKQTKPQELLDLLKNLRQYDHSVLYYGPMNENELTEALAPHLAGLDGELKAVPVNKPYVAQATPENEVLIAPYDAKNIYMRMYHNEQRKWNPEEEPIQTLFNEYFGGGMNTIVFQELRETRGLAYNAWALYRRPGYLFEGATEDFFTHIITQNDKMMDCVRQFHQILDTIPQSEHALQIAKEAILKRIASQRTTKFNIISAWLTARDLGLDYDLSEKVFEIVPKLTMKDLVSFEQQQMAHKPYRYIILGDEKELDMASLAPYGPVKRLTIADIFGY